MDKLLLINRRGPAQGNNAREALDIALAYAVFDIEVALYFTDDGVFQLLEGQEAELVGKKSLNKQMQALPLYDIDKIYVDETALQERGLSPENLSVTAEIIDTERARELLKHYQHCLQF